MLSLQNDCKTNKKTWMIKAFIGGLLHKLRVHLKLRAVRFSPIFKPNSLSNGHNHTTIKLTAHNQLISDSVTLLYFCLPLIPLGASREKKRRLLHVGMPGQDGCYTEIVTVLQKEECTHGSETQPGIECG